PRAGADAIGHARAVEPVTGQVKTGECAFELGGEVDEALMAKLVLRDGASSLAAGGEDRLAAGAERACDVGGGEARELGVVELDELGSGAAAEETGEEHVAGRRAV